MLLYLNVIVSKFLSKIAMKNSNRQFSIALGAPGVKLIVMRTQVVLNAIQKSTSG